MLRRPLVLFDAYDSGDFFDELFRAPGQPRPEAELLVQRVNALALEDLQQRQQTAQNASV
jgi:uncharacterized circularly permuted ATP-grasp superfamily protein